LTKNNPLNAYRETKIKTASQGQLVIMLYDEAVKQIDSAIQLLERKTKQLDRVNAALIRAQEVITELVVSLDFEKGGDIASNLFSLYMYFNQTLMEANMSKDLQSLKRLRPLVSDLRDTWTAVVAKAGTSDTPPRTGVPIAG